MSKALDTKKFATDLDVELSMTKAYCVEEEGRFPKANFKAIAPEAAKGADTLVLETGSIEITNIDVTEAMMNNNKDIEDYKKEWFDRVEASSTSLFKIAEECAAVNPNLSVIIVKRPPRFDRKSKDTLGIKSKLSEFGNKIYDQLQVKSNLSERIHLVELNLIQNSNHLRTIIYGTDNDPRFDGVHLIAGEASSRHFTYRAVQSMYPIIHQIKTPFCARKIRNTRNSGGGGTKKRHFISNRNSQLNNNKGQSTKNHQGKRSYSEVLEGNSQGFSSQSDSRKGRGFKRNNQRQQGTNYQAENNYQHRDGAGSTYNVPINNRFQGNW